MGGPATFDRVQLEVRERDGRLQVKLTEPLHRAWSTRTTLPAICSRTAFQRHSEANYDRYSRLAYTVAMRVLSDGAAAEDVVQDAFLVVWRRSTTYRPERGTARAWLSTIVRNRAIDRLRGEAAVLATSCRSTIQPMSRAFPTRGAR